MMAAPGDDAATELQPPDEFPFPFPPYGVQKDFMKQLWTTVERGHLGSNPVHLSALAAVGD